MEAFENRYVPNVQHRKTETGKHVFYSHFLKNSAHSGDSVCERVPSFFRNRFLDFSQNLPLATWRKICHYQNVFAGDNTVMSFSES